MNRITALPFIPTAQLNESPMSLLRRAAIGNGYTNLLSLLHSLSPNIDHSVGMIGYVARNPTLYKSLCEKLGITDGCRRRVSYKRTGNGREDSVLWQGLEVQIGDLQFSTEKVCIPCYLEKGYTIADWEHFAAIGCPKHQVFLDTSCPVCKTPWSYEQVPLTCGCDPETALSLVRPLHKNRAALLTKIVKGNNQQKILVLSNLRRLFEWWSQLSVHLSQAEQSDYLYHLMTGKWPKLEQDKNAFGVHPRILFLPLLSASDSGTQLLIKKLLEVKTINLRNLNIEFSFITRKDAELLLGISRARFNNFIKQGLVHRDIAGKFDLQQINHLLLISKWLPFNSEKELLWKNNRSIASHFSVAALVKKDVENTPLPAHHSTRSIPSLSQQSILTLCDATHILQANAESIRHLIKIGLIKATKGTQVSAVQWSIKKEELQSFNQKYVFASAIAREINLPVTTTSSRLQSLGLLPISGPGVDKGKTYLFARSDLNSVSNEILINRPYKSPAGRKRINDMSSSATTLTSQQVARELHLDTYQIRFVVRDGWITGSKNSKGHYLFRASDVDNLADKINNDYIDLDRAKDYTDQSIQSFRRTWIISGLVDEYKLGNRRLIKNADLLVVQRLWINNKTSTHIAKQIGRQRSFCINLEKIGLLKPTLIIGKKEKKIKLYPDNHPIYQCYSISS
ncbi:hypothetical protein Q7A_1853 [Methylophaga nitratireducenticrescens]|uniref:TniQ protein n=1 Tax=Methylophaga nitratireducenticrescens TaxID=754476 RepID=I1XJV2_METNJ|nr:helix-turn-helix domain-containing protein [Methylophaga nitratireducenticrescens]AFI84671.1 hypothetical protein Q7A_1853 [Methylophaga nitratireducenticrescens]